MTSACVSKPAMPATATTTESFLDCAPASCSPLGWLSPRVSFSRDEEAPATQKSPEKEKPADLEAPGNELVDFEFRLDDPVAMLPADELFSDGKLVPLQFAARRPSEIQSPEPVRCRRMAEVIGSDPYALSPRAPRCTSRWRELLGLKRMQSPKSDADKPAPSKSPAAAAAARSLKLHFLHRHGAKPANLNDSSLSLPLLRDSDPDVLLAVSARRSLSSSSSSSGADHDELPRLSLDSEKPGRAAARHAARARVARAVRSGTSPAGRAPALALSVDSPRMNASGRVVFEGLERSSSSPGSFNGGPRPRPRGVERSYSANVRVLNVPVCSLRGPSGKSVFGQLFSPQKPPAAKTTSPSTTAAAASAASGGGQAGKMKTERGPRD